MWLRGGFTFCRTTWIVPTGTSVQSGSLRWGSTSAELLLDRIRTGGECHGRTLLSLRKILRIHQSMNDIPNKFSTAKLWTIPNYIGSLISQIFANNRMFSPNRMATFVAVRRLGICCCLIFDSRYLFKDAL